MLQPQKTKADNPASRYGWIDQVKGFTIFLVVYGHNFPFCEKYVYSFHMPLFIMVAGFFHPKSSNGFELKKRFTALVIPYFIWSFLLFAIWLLITRHYGESAGLDLSPAKNFLGIFAAQGDRPYMDWGIPMWFLPALFITFLMLWLVMGISNRILQAAALTFLIVIGLAYPHFTSINLPWSINIAMAALFFYALGFYGFGWILALTKNRAALFMVAAGLAHLALFDANGKIDIYRAVYGNEGLFLLNGLTGSVFVLCFFKVFPVFKFLEFVGKFSLTILALQLLAMTAIKFAMMVAIGRTVFDFTETERLLYAIVQIALMVPAFFLINKYTPVLNGGYKKI